MQGGMVRSSPAKPVPFLEPIRVSRQLSSLPPPSFFFFFFFFFSFFFFF
eukprot:SAG11_NODE_1499_length_4787_cov_14.242747_5_plen_49_part_00